ncbi:MAG: 4Fe-4S binding protein [Raoultibacter sp.]
MSTYDVTTFDDWKPSDFPIGVACPDAGNSKLYITGGWRSQRPVWSKDACKNCMLCWAYCPDSSIEVKDGEMTGIDYDHCKGCGVCVNECKFGALEMISESEAREA